MTRVTQVVNPVGIALTVGDLNNQRRESDTEPVEPSTIEEDEGHGSEVDYLFASESSSENGEPYFGTMEDFVVQLEADRRRVERVRYQEPLDVVADEPRPVEGVYCLVTKKTYPQGKHLYPKVIIFYLIVDHMYFIKSYLTCISDTLLTSIILILLLLLRLLWPLLLSRTHQHPHRNRQHQKQSQNQSHHHSHRQEMNDEKSGSFGGSGTDAGAVLVNKTLFNQS